MNKYTIISIVSAAISVVAALSIIFVKKEPMSLDLMSALVGVLSLLVTVLAIFWAFSYFSFEKRLKQQVDEEVQKMNLAFNQKINDVNVAMNSIMDVFNKTAYLSMSNSGQIIACLDNLLIDQQTTNHYACKLLLDTVAQCLADGADSISISAEDKVRYIACISSIDHEDKEQILHFIMNAEETPRTEAEIVHEIDV